MTTPSQAAFKAWVKEEYPHYSPNVPIIAKLAWQAAEAHGRKQALEEAAAKFSGIDIHYTLTTGTITNVIKGLLK